MKQRIVKSVGGYGIFVICFFLYTGLRASAIEVPSVVQRYLTFMEEVGRSGMNQKTIRDGETIFSKDVAILDLNNIQNPYPANNRQMFFYQLGQRHTNGLGSWNITCKNGVHRPHEGFWEFFMTFDYPQQNFDKKWSPTLAVTLHVAQNGEIDMIQQAMVAE